MSSVEGMPTFFAEGGFLTESFLNEEVDMRLFSLKIVALLTAIANIAAFGGFMRTW